MKTTLSKILVWEIRRTSFLLSSLIPQVTKGTDHGAKIPCRNVDQDKKALPDINYYPN